jgi:hypothetical protein
MRGSGLSALAASAAVRLYARSVEIEIEVEGMIADGDHMTAQELLAWLDDDFDLDFDQEWERADDPGIEAWRRAIHLRHRLSVAALRPAMLVVAPAQLRLASEAETSG